MGDWVVTPRRGKAVEINALWFNALQLLDGWLRGQRRRRDGANVTQATPAAPGIVQRPLLVRRRRLSLRRGRQRRRRRRSRLPPEPDLRHLARSPRARARALGLGGRCRRTRAAHAGRLALALARSIPITSRTTTAISDPRRRLPSGHRLGLADRPLHRCLAEGPSRRDTRRAPVPRRLPRTSERSGHRAPSAKSSTPRRRTRRAAASPKPGASPKCSAAG